MMLKENVQTNVHKTLMTKTITISNSKGGVAKTTTTINLGACLEELGYKILFIDLDFQCNMTSTLGASISDGNVYELMTRHKSVNDVIQTTSNGHEVIASHPNINNLEIELSKDGKQAITRLNDAIKPIKDKYDYILIDTHPSIDVLLVNAIETSDIVIMPTETDMDGYKGISNIVNEINKSKRPIDKYILITRYESRINDYKEMVTMLDNMTKKETSKLNGCIVLDTKIRKNIALRKASIKRTDVTRYDNKSNGYIDYQALANEIMERANTNGKQ